MTLLIDTHCHLADPAFAADVGEVVARMAESGVGHAIVIGETPAQADKARELANRFPSLSATAGLHPHEAATWSPPLATDLEHRLRDDQTVAIGECGLDYHYDHSPRPIQRLVFEAQLDMAARIGKPVVIHSRDADDDMAAILRNHPRATAIMHSYSSGPALLEAAIGLGHYISWSGMITFRSWAFNDGIRSVPRDRLLIETDAPYLAPVPFRGKRNEPSFLVATARKLAEILGLEPEEAINITAENAVRLFGARLGTS